MASRRGITVLAGLALVLAGCGDRNVVLSVDILSFLSPNQTQTAFGPVPGVPGGAATGELPLVDDQQIQLFEGLGDASQVKAVTVTALVQCADSTGSGTDTLRVYLSSSSDPPRSQPPIIATVLPMVPGQIDTVTAVINGSQQLADLFTRKLVRLSITNSLRGPDVGETLNSRIRLIELRAVVVAGRKSV
jgi:hypothetical protein